MSVATTFRFLFLSSNRIFSLDNGIEFAVLDFTSEQHLGRLGRTPHFLSSEEMLFR
jgi:hypothetical protein